MSDSLSFVCVGHVDHGKSSLIGRLLVDTDSIASDAVEKVRRICDERGKQFEYAFLLDAYEEERDQGITIETMKIEFSTAARDYTIIDAPGHKEFLKNMATGASHAQAALLLVDAKEGVQEQTRKHAYVLRLLGITQVSVVINKMDLVDYGRERFEEVRSQVVSYLSDIGISPTAVIPLSAMKGDNVVSLSGNMSWYSGSTLVEAIDSFEQEVVDEDKPLRFPLQDVYKFDDRRILAGTIESGSVSVGDSIAFWPSGKHATVQSIEGWPESVNDSVSAGESVGVTIDEEFFLRRGEVITLASQKPSLSTFLSVTVFWMSKEPLVLGEEYLLRINTQEVSCRVHTIEKVIDSETLEGLDRKEDVKRYEVAQVLLHADEPIVFDLHSENASMGRFVLVSDTDVVGGGIINESPEHLSHRESLHPRSMLISPKEHSVSLSERVSRNSHRPLVVWITGLAGSGKNDLAYVLERRLFDAGVSAYYLDSSDVRMTLSSDLSFSKKQRSEHSRRVGELANVLRGAGHVVLVSIISPFLSDRKRVSEIVGSGSFLEVFVDTSLDECRKVNPHGIYERVDKGEIRGVPGVDIAFEQSPDALVVSQDDVDVLFEEVVSRVR